MFLFKVRRQFGVRHQVKPHQLHGVRSCRVCWAGEATDQ